MGAVEQKMYQWSFNRLGLELGIEGDHAGTRRPVRAVLNEHTGHVDGGYTNLDYKTVTQTRRVAIQLTHGLANCLLQLQGMRGTSDRFYFKRHRDRRPERGVLIAQFVYESGNKR